MLRPYTSTEKDRSPATNYFFNGTDMYKFANSSKLPQDPVVVSVMVSMLCALYLHTGCHVPYGFVYKRSRV